MYSYHIYGLNIESELELIQLLPSIQQKADVSIRLGAIEDKPTIPEDAWRAKWVEKNNACYVFEDIGAFLMQHGQVITIDLCKNANMVEVGHALLGIALSVILQQRGYLILHSSLIEIEGHAVGFLGHSGNGKSSLATMMIESGYKLISDDLAVINLDLTEQITVYSGFPQTKLWPDFADSIGINAEELPLVMATIDKRTRLIPQYFTEQLETPIDSFYILDQGDNLEITDVKGHQCIIELVEYSYDIDFTNLIGGLPTHFKQCTQLAQNITIKRLTRPWSLDLMPDVVKAIEHDVYQRLD